MKRKYFLLVVILVITGGSFCRYVLAYGDAKWLQVETLSSASMGQPFSVRVILSGQEQGRFLGVNLHWMGKDKVPQGYVAGSMLVNIIPGKSVYDISLNVPPWKDIFWIIPVVFISHDGSWTERSAAARVESIPVMYNPGISTDAEMKLRRAYHINRTMPVSYMESMPLSLFITELWIVIAIAGFAQQRCIKYSRFNLLAIFTSAWEAFGVSFIALKIMRYLALYSEIYSERREMQQFLTIVIIIATALFLLYLIRNIRGTARIIQISTMGIFWGVTLLQMLSLHEVDSMLSKTLVGIQAAQILRLLASLACLGVTIFMFIYNKPKKENTYKI